ncbi:hypothetical protein JK358_34990 [Nocardia sp. 2]|uniref:Uncharacterized protein n=1 Tax=Nocardia acididurans TaxID=2802282 RepID=A0ABS1MH78_9NOCA|nr:hypothetical protein [Nocardia acididurans]MBL1079624.1 hypothetical protein [Nocardia acididurans]
MRKILSFSVAGIPVVGFLVGSFLLLVTVWFAAVFRDTPRRAGLRRWLR